MIGQTRLFESRLSLVVALCLATIAISCSNPESDVAVPRSLAGHDGRSVAPSRPSLAAVDGCELEVLCRTVFFFQTKSYYQIPGMLDAEVCRSFKADLESGERSGTVGSRMFYASVDEVLMSDDGGRTWACAARDSENTNFPFNRVLSIQVTRDEELYAHVGRAGEGPSVGKILDALLRSSDSGEFWHQVQMPRGTVGIISFYFESGEQGGALVDKWPDELEPPLQEDRLKGGFSASFQAALDEQGSPQLFYIVTLDGGASWKEYDGPSRESTFVTGGVNVEEWYRSMFPPSAVTP